MSSPPTPSSRPLDALAVAVTVGLCLSWGFNNVAIKIAIHDIPPLIQSSARSAISALVVFAWTQFRGMPLFKRDGTLKAGIWVGILFTLEFVLIYRGLVWTTATRGVLFLYLAPFFVVIGSRWLIPGDHFSAVAMVRAVVVVSSASSSRSACRRRRANPHQMLGDVMLVGAGAAWGATTLADQSEFAQSHQRRKDAALSARGFSAAACARRAGLRRAHRRHAFGCRARRFRLSECRGERHVCDVVRPDRALLGGAAVGVHVSGTAVRRRRRPLRLERAVDAGFRRGGCLSLPAASSSSTGPGDAISWVSGRGSMQRGRALSNNLRY